jgi:glucose-1-phosphate cytidylyltransferase
MGTRIRDVGEDIPKPMIPIGGRPILWHIMKRYSQFGYRRFVLCLGYKSWVIKQYFLDYNLAGSDITVELGCGGGARIHSTPQGEDWEVTLVETGLHTMTGGRVKRVEKYIDGDEFLLTYGDGVSDVDVHTLVDYHRRHGGIGTVTAVQPPGRFGEIDLDGTRVVEFNEKPPQSPGRINGGFFVFRREFLDRLGDDPGLVLERRPLFDLARDGQLHAFPHDGFWQCMDNSRDYHLLNQLWDGGQAPWHRRDAVPLRAAA